MKNIPEKFDSKPSNGFKPEFWQNELSQKEEVARKKTIELKKLEEAFLNTEDSGERLKLSGLIARIKGEISMAKAIQDISKSQIAGIKDFEN